MAFDSKKADEYLNNSGRSNNSAPQSAGGFSSEKADAYLRGKTAATDAASRWENDFQRHYNSYVSAQKRDGRSRWLTDSSYGHRSKFQELLDRYESATSDIEDEGERSRFQSAYGTIGELMQLFDENDRFYGQFSGQDEYDRFRSNYDGSIKGYDPAKFGLTEEQARSIRMNLSSADQQARDDAIAMIQEGRNKLSGVSGHYSGSYAQNAGITRNVSSGYGAMGSKADIDFGTERANDAFRQITDAGQARADADRSLRSYRSSGNQTMDDYYDVRQNQGFDNTDISYTGPSVRELYELGSQVVDGLSRNGEADGLEQFHTDDKLGLYFTATEEDKQNIIEGNPASSVVWEGMQGDWDLMEDSEIKTYYWLLNNQSREDAYSYLDSLTPALNRRANDNQIEAMENASGFEKAMLVAASVPAQLAANVADPFSVALMMARDDVNEYSHALDFSRFAQNIRAVTGEDIGKFVGDRFGDTAAEYAKNTYAAILSGIDSYVGASTLGGVGYQLNMSMGAGAQKAIELYKSGATLDQIYTGAAISGLVEAITEKYSIEAFMNSENAPFLLALFESAIAEGSEEVASELLNLVSDAVIQGSNSDLRQRIRYYKEHGFSDSDARNKALLEAVQETLWAGYGGLVSGGFMVGGRGAVNGALAGLNNAIDYMAAPGEGAALMRSGGNTKLLQLAQEVADEKMREKLIKQAEAAGQTYREAARREEPTTGRDHDREVGKAAQDIKKQFQKDAQNARRESFEAKAKQFVKENEGKITNPQKAVKVLTKYYAEEGFLPGDRAMLNGLAKVNGTSVQGLVDQIERSSLNDAALRQTKAKLGAFKVDMAAQGVELDGGVKESSFQVNDDAADDQAYLKTADGGVEPVNITGIADLKDGKLTLTTDDGQTVSAGDVVYGTSEQAALYATIQDISTSSRMAKSIADMFKKGGISFSDFNGGLREAFNLGANGVAFGDINSASVASRIDENTRRMAWKAGQVKAAENRASKASQLADKKVGVSKKGGIKYEGVDPKSKSLTDLQKTNLKLAEAVAALGLDVTVFASDDASRADASDSSYRRNNGYYFTEDGSFRFDLNAGDDAQGVMAYAIAHELTHFARAFNPEQFNLFANTVISELEKEGYSWQNILNKSIERQKRLGAAQGKTDTELYDLAYDEAFAELMEGMLAHTDALNRISQQIHQKDAGLWEKVKNFLTGLMEKLQSLYNGKRPESVQDQKLFDAITRNQSIVDAWVNAVTGSVENYNQQTGETEQKKNTSDGVLNMARSNDSLKRDFSWQELTQLPPMNGYTVFESAKNNFMVNGKIDISSAMQMIYSMCKTVQGNGATPSYYLKASDIGKNVHITNYFLDHSVFTQNTKGKATPQQIDKVLIALDIPNILRNAVEVNTSTKHQSFVRPYNHIMLGVSSITRTNGTVDYYAVRLRIQERADASAVLKSFNVVGKLDALTAKKIATTGAKKANANRAPNGSLFTYNVADLLRDVKDEYNDTFSLDVYNHMNMQRAATKNTAYLMHSSRNISRETMKANLDAYKAQRDAEAKATKAVYEAEREQMEAYHKKQMTDMERSYSYEVEEIQNAFFSLARNYEAKTMDAAALSQMVDELQEALAQEIETSNADKDQLRMQVNSLLSSYESKALEAGAKTEMIDELQTALDQEIESHNYDKSTMQKRINSLLANYGAKGQMVDELQQALDQEIESHSFDKELWQKQFRQLKDAFDKSGNDIKKLEKKITEQRKAAKAKVESHKKVEMRHKIQRTVDTLNRYLNNSGKTMKVPERLRGSVATALEAINSYMGDSKAENYAKRMAEYESQMRKLQKDPSGNAEKIDILQGKIDRLNATRNKFKNALQDLLNSYAATKDEADSLYDLNVKSYIEYAFNVVGDTEYRNLSLRQMDAVLDAYKAVLKYIRDANHTFAEQRNVTIGALATRALDAMKETGDRKKTTNALKKNAEAFIWNSLKPFYAFQKLNNKVFADLYKNLRKGEDAWYRDVNGARAYFVEKASKYGYFDWDQDKLYNFESTDGREFQLNLDGVMSLYAYTRREQAIDHLMKGGIVISESTERKGKFGITETVTDSNAYQLSLDTIRSLTEILTADQMSFANEMQQYLSEVMGEKGNEVSLQLYDIKLFKERYYWPLRSSGDYSEVARENRENPSNKVKNSSFTKKTVEHANNPVELMGFMDTWSKHVSDMSMYHAFTLPMEDFYRVYNWHGNYGDEDVSSLNMRARMKQAYGNAAVDYIDTLLKDLNGGVRADPREGIFNAGLSKFKKAAVLASMSVTIQQPSAIGRAFAVIDARYFAGGKVEKADEAWEQCKKYAPIAGIKEMGRFEMDMGRSTTDFIMAQSYTGFGQKFKGVFTDGEYREELLGLLPEKADQITWTAIWEAAKRQTAAQNPGLHGEALLQKAGELFTGCIEQTQVYDSVFSRSGYMRSKSGSVQAMTAFMAEPTTTANMITEAMRQIRSGSKAKAAKMMASVATAIVINSMLASIVYAARDDDTEKTFWEKYFGSLAENLADGFNPFTYIPFVKDIYSLFQGYDVSRSDMSLFADLYKAVTKLAKVWGKRNEEMDEEELKEWKENLLSGSLSCLDSLANLIGVPIRNLRRDVKAFLNLFYPKYAGNNWGDTNMNLIWDSMMEGAAGTLPELLQPEKPDKYDALYKAITGGDAIALQREQSRYDDKDKLENAMRTALRNNDPRVREAAEALLSGDNGRYLEIMDAISAEGYFPKEIVKGAVNSAANKINSKSKENLTESDRRITQAAELIIAGEKAKANDIIASVIAEGKFSRNVVEGAVNAVVSDLKTGGYYTTDDYVYSVAHGIGSAKTMEQEIIRVMTLNGKSKGEAEKSFVNSVKANLREAIEYGEISDAQAVKVLMAAGAFEDETVTKKGVTTTTTAEEQADLWVYRYNAKAETGDDTVWSEAEAAWYRKNADGSLSKSTYSEYLALMRTVTGTDRNNNGYADRGSREREAAMLIDQLPITDSMKQLLFRRKFPTGKFDRVTPWYKRSH